MMTFEQLAGQFLPLDNMKSGREKHRHDKSQWLASFILPVIGSKAIDEIDVRDMVDIYTRRKDALASVRAAVALAGRVIGYGLDMELSNRPNVAEIALRRFIPQCHVGQEAPLKHRPMLPVDDVPRFIEVLREQVTPQRMALEMIVLTGARSNMVLGATIGEVRGNLWAVPPERMKSGLLFELPLPERCMELVRQNIAGRNDPSSYIFCSTGKLAGRQLADKVMRDRVTGWRSANGEQCTVHGFRATMRTWLARQGVTRDDAEDLQARVTTDKTQRAYDREANLVHRLSLLSSWQEAIERSDMS